MSISAPKRLPIPLLEHQDPDPILGPSPRAQSPSGRPRDREGPRETPSLGVPSHLLGYLLPKTKRARTSLGLSTDFFHRQQLLGRSEFRPARHLCPVRISVRVAGVQIQENLVWSALYIYDSPGTSAELVGYGHENLLAFGTSLLADSGVAPTMDNLNTLASSVSQQLDYSRAATLVPDEATFADKTKYRRYNSIATVQLVDEPTGFSTDKFSWYAWASDECVFSYVEELCKANRLGPKSELSLKSQLLSHAIAHRQKYVEANPHINVALQRVFGMRVKTLDDAVDEALRDPQGVKTGSKGGPSSDGDEVQFFKAGGQLSYIVPPPAPEKRGSLEMRLARAQRMKHARLTKINRERERAEQRRIKAQLRKEAQEKNKDGNDGTADDQEGSDNEDNDDHEDNDDNDEDPDADEDEDADASGSGSDQGESQEG